MFLRKKARRWKRRAGCCGRVAFQQRQRVLQEALEFLQELAPVAPSMTRWSPLKVTFMRGRTAMVSSARTTGFLMMLATARIAPCAGSMIAWNSDVKTAEIGHGERAARVFARLKLLVAGLLDQFPAGLGDLAERQMVGVADHGDDQAVVQGDGDADTDAAPG